jgi:hypothetical protein
VSQQYQSENPSGLPVDHHFIFCKYFSCKDRMVCMALLVLKPYFIGERMIAVDFKKYPSFYPDWRTILLWNSMESGY